MSREKVPHHGGIRFAGGGNFITRLAPDKVFRYCCYAFFLLCGGSKTLSGANLVMKLPPPQFSEDLGLVGSFLHQVVKLSKGRAGTAVSFYNFLGTGRSLSTFLH